MLAITQAPIDRVIVGLLALYVLWNVSHYGLSMFTAEDERDARTSRTFAQTMKSLRRLSTHGREADETRQQGETRGK